MNHEDGRGHGDGVKGGKMEDILAVPPTQGTDFFGVVNSDGCVSRVFRSNDFTGRLNIAWGILRTLSSSAPKRILLTTYL